MKIVPFAQLAATGKLILMLSIVLATCTVASAQTLTADNPNMKTFPQSDKVISQKAYFYNRFGIQIVGDMYMPKDINLSRKHAAIIVGHPYSGVKEQTASLYAQAMAERGFVTIAIDLSYNGESGGDPRRLASPEGYVEDFMAAVGYIGTRPYVDRQRIGVLGICGSAGFTISAAAIDPRMKAIAAVSMYDMGRANRQGLNDVVTEEQRRQRLKDVAEQRWREFEGEPVAYSGRPSRIDENTPAPTREFFEYYSVPRGQHPSSTGAITVTSVSALMNFFPFQMIETISPRPLLFIVGENAHSRYFSEDAFKLAAEPKELYIVPGAGHVDLYDRMELIPFDKLETFFKDNLK